MGGSTKWGMVKNAIIILNLCNCGKVFWNKNYCCLPKIKKKRGRPFGSFTKNRKRRKRLNLPKELREIVYKRSKFICEQNACINRAKPIHHKISVSKRPDLQFELWNLIHLCVPCHRNRYPELPDCLFY